MTGPFAERAALDTATLVRMAFLIVAAIPVATVLIGLFGIITARTSQASRTALHTVLWGAVGVAIVNATYYIVLYARISP